MKFNDFLKGYGSIFNLFPEDEKITHFNIPTTSDEEAVSKDWETVGNDLYNAMEFALNETQQSYDSSVTFDTKNHHC